jgi:hypothetical protein
MKPNKMIQKTVMVGLATLMLSSVVPDATAQGNLVVNGGFDIDASGWTIINVANIVGYSSSFGKPAGSVFLYNPSFGPSQPSPTTSQEINGLTPEQLYVVSGEYGGAGKNTTENSFGVALDGNFLFETLLPADNNWHNFSFSYMAASTSTLLSLSAQINGTDDFYSVDNIVLQAIPEPGVLGLLSLSGLAFRWHRRNWRWQLFTRCFIIAT